MEQQLIDILNKFGEASKHIFAAKILASQITACIWLAVIAFAIYTVVKKAPALIDSACDDDMFSAVLLWAGVIVVVGALLGLATYAIHTLVAPEYTLILELIRNVK